MLSLGYQRNDIVIFILISPTMHCAFHCVFTLCSFHISFYHSHSKSNSVNLTIPLCFLKDWPIYHFNVQTAMVEDKEQDTLSNIISVRFQNCDFFPLRYTLKQVLLKCRQITWKTYEAINLWNYSYCKFIFEDIPGHYYLS